MARRRKSVSPKVQPVALEAPVVAVSAEPPTVPVEVKAVRPTAKCIRCSRAGEGLLCRRCGVELHGNPGEGLLYSTPVNPTVGW